MCYKHQGYLWEKAIAQKKQQQFLTSPTKATGLLKETPALSCEDQYITRCCTLQEILYYAINSMIISFSVVTSI
jgi:hypothetical protein